MSIAAVNTRNQFQGRVANIRRGSVVSEVEMLTANGVISAIVTTSSIDLINLQVGEETLAMFKATDVLIAKLG